MSENESTGAEVTGDILDVAKKVASAGDRWFLSFARSLGRAAGRVKQETDIVTSSAKAAAATTGRVTSKMAKRIKPNFFGADSGGKPAKKKTPNDLLKVVAEHYGIDESVLRGSRDALDTLELLHIMCTPKESPAEVTPAPAPTVAAPSETVREEVPAPVFVQEAPAPVPVIESKVIESDTIPWGMETASKLEPSRSEFTQPDYLQPAFMVPDYVQAPEPQAAPATEPEVAQAAEPEVAPATEPEAAPAVEPETAQVSESQDTQDAQVDSEDQEPSSSEIPIYDPTESDAAPSSATTTHSGSKRGKKHHRGHRS